MAEQSEDNGMPVSEDRQVSDAPEKAATVEPMSSENLLSAIDTQIKFEADRLSSEGWTRWAIWGALAALVWVGSELWSLNKTTLEQMALVALLVFVVRRALEESAWMLLPSSRLEIGTVRYRRTADEINPRRAEIVFGGLQHLVIISVLVHFEIPGQWLLWLYVSIGIVVSGIGLIAGSLTIGFPASISLRTAIYLTTFVQVMFLTAAGWQISRLIYLELPNIALGDVRLALVLNAGVFLVSRLVRMTSSEHLLSKLTQLRQHIAFGRISLKDANKKAEEVLSGITLSELFAPMVQSVELEIKGRHVAIGEIEQVLNNLNEKLSAQRAPPHELLRALDHMGSPPTAIIRDTQRLKRAWQRLGSNALGCSFYSPESRAELNAITNEVRSQLKDSDAKARDCVVRYNSMKAELYRTAAANSAD